MSVSRVTFIKGRRDEDQRLVAGCMTVAVVDVLEVIHVDHQECTRADLRIGEPRQEGVAI